MQKILLSWIGFKDLDASIGKTDVGVGPVAQTLSKMSFERVLLLTDHSKEKNDTYLRWLKSQTTIPIELKPVALQDPTDFGALYPIARDAIEVIYGEYGPNTELTIQTSPGTPSMAAIWILLCSTQFQKAKMLASSDKHGIKEVVFPFDISAEFLPGFLRKSDQSLIERSQGLAPKNAAFEKIIARSPQMTRVLSQAQKVALRSIPALIEGESGTGKELLARAIHNASPRSKKPFVAINCGAIPSSLLESELFGHERGSFTGANTRKDGAFQRANGGTLFLDEIGEMPLADQVKLLRALQEGEVLRVGGEKAERIEARIIAATNRELMQEVLADRFREDLYYRLAVAVLRLPPLREREGDVGLLVESLLSYINEDNQKETGTQPKKLSPKAKNLLLRHSWPGNVRELQNVLQRAVLWSEEESIQPKVIEEALSISRRKGAEAILDRPLGDGFSLDALLGEVEAHYLLKAEQEAQGKKTKAAELLGFENYQTFDNRRKRLKTKK